MSRSWLRLTRLLPFFALVACGGTPTADVNAPLPPARAVSEGGSSAAVDPLGARPEPQTPEPYTPPAAETYAMPGGLRVWLLPRHGLPIVSFTLAVPHGSASDPAKLDGLAAATANMLDEGAGSRGAIALSEAIEGLGATLNTGANADFSFVSLTTLSQHVEPALNLFADVVARPRFEAADWKRVHELWKNELINRPKNPGEVASLVAMSALYGFEHPYGHPSSGTLASASRVKLEDVRRFYERAWRPETATLVVVGDIRRAELDPVLERALGSWKAKAQALPIVVPGDPEPPSARVVLVDRPDAPQAVLSLIRAGVPVTNDAAAILPRVNAALGGSFTSRLNQHLREEKGWSYGARSRVTSSRGVGPIVATASVFVDKTGDAAEAMLADVARFSSQGLTEAEAEKTRLLARQDLVELFQTTDVAALRLARDAALGLSADYESKASLARDRAGLKELNAVAERYFDPKPAVLVIVGPAAKIGPQLAAHGISAPRFYDAEGRPIKNAR